MTERLYYLDSYLTKFSARVVDRSADGLRITLDRTAFYPDSGGQPHDTGFLSGVPVVDVVDEEERIVHVMAAPLADNEVEGVIDWPRRFDHMQQHSGQHLLSAVMSASYGIETVSFHLGADSSTIDVNASSLDAKRVIEIERRANELIAENRPVTVGFEDAANAADLRKASAREGTLRIVTIEGLDRSACGGTHVRATGEIGSILLRGFDRIRGNLRIEFLCGLRAVRRARMDFEALSRISKTLSTGFDETPDVVDAQCEALQAAEKTLRRLSTDLAGFRGRELYEATPQDADGRRHTVQRQDGSLGDDVRSMAQAFTAQPGAVFLALANDPPSVLFAVSADTGLNAGVLLKAALAKAGGRGGGGPQVAQGSVPTSDALALVAAELEKAGR